MTFEAYAREWLERQNFIKSTRKWTRQGLEIYTFPVIGGKEITEVTEEDIDRIFTQERLFNRKGDFMERTFRTLDTIFEEMVCENLIPANPVLHIYDPVVLSHEKVILGRADVELTAKSPFVDVSCMWLKGKGYKPVTYNLYYHFLTGFIHPFIGKKPIGLVDQNNIKRIYTYFNTVNTNSTWISQIQLVMRMVFDYAIEKGLIQNNPMLRIDDAHLEPILVLSRNQKNSVRAAFARYGFRKTRLKELSHELYGILHVEKEFHNREGIRKNDIIFRTVFEQWHRNTQDGVLSEATALSSFHSMDIYMLPNIGDKAIQEISPSDLETITKVYALMGNTSDFYILTKLRSLYDFAIEKGYVSENIAYRLKSANNKAAEKLILSDEEIKEFFRTCNGLDTMYTYLFAVILCTGLRIREGLAVSHSNIDLQMKSLKIQNQIKDGRLHPATKTRRGRKIRLSKTTLAFIEAAKIQQSVYELQGGFRNEHKLVFTTETGSPLSYTNLNRKLDEIAMKTGRPDITAHTLRHTYMTVSARCGENLDEIQSEVGHGYSSDVITEYLHQTEESIHESAVRRQEYLEKIMREFGTAPDEGQVDGNG